MTAREISSPWSMTDSRNGRQAPGDFTAYVEKVGDDKPDPKVSLAQAYADVSALIQPSVPTSDSPVPAEKEQQSLSHGPSLPPL